MDEGKDRINERGNERVIWMMKGKDKKKRQERRQRVWVKGRKGTEKERQSLDVETDGGKEHREGENENK